MADATSRTASESLSEALARLEAGTLVEGRWFKDTIIRLDGYHFKRCRFDGCKLAYFTPDFQFTECAFGEKCTILHGPFGVLAIKTFHIFFPKMDGLWSGFAPIRHPNGTMSLNSDYIQT